MTLKLSVKSGKDGTGTLFGHIGDEISKNRGKKKVHWVSMGHETEFALSFLFLNAFNQSLLLLCVL
jgi:hypothetical protein